MPSQVLSAVENNFTKGLITEATGLNFPENAATSADNCIFTLIGDVTRRQGMDLEPNGVYITSTNANQANTCYKWTNVGGDGQTEIVVRQVGADLFFYLSSAATTTTSVSAELLVSGFYISSFLASGSTFDSTQECQYSDGNGYLFIFHPNCDPVYCTYNSSNQGITPNLISISIRDQVGIPEAIPVNVRPTSLSNIHLYNLENQGWTVGTPWAAVSMTGVVLNTGSIAFTVQSGLTISAGTNVSITGTIYNGVVTYTPFTCGGTVSSYSGTTLTVTVYSITPFTVIGDSTSLAVANGYYTYINPVNYGHINTWYTAEANYPSNADQWWAFKDNTDVFNPGSTVGNVTTNSGQAPQGFFILNAFNQSRSAASGLTSLNTISTSVRPRTGAWFQGRVWYAGVDSNFQATGTAPYTTWTENIYFSQVVSNPSDFGNCYQINDPTSQDLFGELATDGGVIVIQGSGSIYKLFSMQNALIVFAANGIWYITGNSGIGFTANDYTIIKLSAVRNISGSSYVDVNGLPMFWNEEGIYQLQVGGQSQNLMGSPLHSNQIEVVPLTLETILTLYSDIPISSKLYAKGIYDPINYIVQWVYKDTAEVSVFDRYVYDRVLIYNTYNKAFYTYTVDTTVASINGILYLSSSTQGINSPEPSIKYLITRNSDYGKSFGQEINTDYLDWNSVGSSLGVNYVSYFVTGYRLHGQGQKWFQMPYVYMYSRNTTPSAYSIQSLWDFATSGNSGRWSARQIVTIFDPNFGMIVKRHRLRGRGLALQIKVSSIQGQPFDIMGWSTYETVNTGV